MTIPHEGVIVLLFQGLEQMEASTASWGTSQKIQTSYILFRAHELYVIKSGLHRYENRESKPRSIMPLFLILSLYREIYSICARSEATRALTTPSHYAQRLHRYKQPFKSDKMR